MVITSEISTVQVINGNQYDLTTMTVALGPGDEGVPQQLAISDPVSGNVYTVTINSIAPSYIYSRNLRGWIPGFQQCVENVVPLLISTPPQSSSVQNLAAPSVSSSPSSGSGLESSYHYTSSITAPLLNRPNPNDHQVPALHTKQKRVLATTSRSPDIPSIASQFTWGGYAKIFGTGVVAGFATDAIWGGLCHISGFASVFSCGSGGNDKAALKVIYDEVTTLQNQTNNIAQDVFAIQNWENSTQSSINYLTSQANAAQGQINENAAAIKAEDDKIASLLQITQAMQYYYNNATMTLQSEFSAAEYQEQALYNFTLGSLQLVNNQLQAIYSQLNSIDSTVSQLSMLVDSIYKRVMARRAILVAFWNNTVNTQLPVPTCLFVQCIGQPPLATPNNVVYSYANQANCPPQPASCLASQNTIPGTNLLSPTIQGPATDIQTLRSLPYAAELAVVRLQYTTSSTPRLAVERQFHYVCDKINFLNTFMPYIGMRDLFRAMGPPPINGSYCYNTSNPSAGNWTCDCVIVQIMVSCELATSAPMFPFGWNQTLSLASSTQLSQYCTTSLATTAIQAENTSVAAQINSVGSVFSNLTNWFTFAQSFCLSATTQWVTYTDGRNVRLAADASGGYTDMSLPLTNSASMAATCNPDFNYILSVSNPTTNIFFLIYSFWISGYDTIGVIYQAFWEGQVFGTMPTSTPPLESSFNWRPDIVQTTSEFKLTTVHYAGTGIGVQDLPYSPSNPDPNLVTSTYPPPPNFATAPSPNTNKVPVYYISPVLESYAPTISIQLNGGPAQPCQISGNLSQSQCTVPLNNVTGLNFSAALSVSLTSAWSNLLPAEQYIIGDYSYDLNAEQVIYDVPADMLPLGYNVKSQCNTLMYLFQPRNSSFINNTLFNIPDLDFETPISAQNWADFYNTFFDSTCACSSAASYAKTVDAQGQCISGTNPDGSANASLPNPGNFDLCTILQAYRIVVPNYVAAYMEFQPTEYTIQATFQVPKGQIIQFVSTSCPTAYQILKPNGASGNTEVIFYTNQTTPQKVTIQVTQFNLSYICNSVEPLTVTYTNSTPAVYANIPKCGTQYVNVYPYLSNAPCYPYPGLEMYAATSSNNPPVMSSSTLEYITAVQDSTYNSLIDMIVEFTILSSQLQNIPYYYAITSEEAQKQVQQINSQQQQIIANMSISGASEQNLKRVNEEAGKQFNSSSQIINEALLKSEAGSKSSHDILTRLNQTIAQANEANNKSLIQEQILKNQTEQFNRHLNEQQAKLQDDIDNLGSGGGDSCSISWVPFLGDLLCSLWDGIDSVIQFVLGILVWIVVFCLILMCVNSGCCTSTCKCMSKACCSVKRHEYRRHYDSDFEEEAEEDEPRKPQKRTKTKKTKDGSKYEEVDKGSGAAKV